MELFTVLPVWYQKTLVVLFGLIIGSFLNVVIYRFHTGKSLSGSSHCLSCGHKLRWYELFPLLSYLFLRGRCRECGCYIPVRYFVVEFSTAILFLLAYMQFSFGVLFLFSVPLIAVLMVVTVYDIYHMIIPDVLVILMSIMALVHHMLIHTAGYVWEDSLPCVFAAFGAFGFYGGLWFVSKGRWIGFGDAKLAIPLGFILGPWGTFSFIVLSFWVGALVSVFLLLYPRMAQQVIYFSRVCMHRFRTCPQVFVVNSGRSITIKSEVPFAPFMIVAFLLVYLYRIDVLELISLVI